uniref:Uncharacterized protein n=1 Tax=Nelumbo nucifera TaxID=4432 RepID=A0A822Y7U0_NELNU|nr:TPA_asm: hypothetical protein HUJ06_029109 [Nelumbo nucifera]
MYQKVQSTLPWCIRAFLNGFHETAFLPQPTRKKGNDIGGEKVNCEKHSVRDSDPGPCLVLVIREMILVPFALSPLKLKTRNVKG